MESSGGYSPDVLEKAIELSLFPPTPPAPGRHCCTPFPPSSRLLVTPKKDLAEEEGNALS